MDKSFMIFIAIGIGFFYLITNFVGDIEKDDGYPTTSLEQQEHKYDKYISSDSVGRSILTVNGISRKEQIEAWNHSPIKVDFMSFYPDFDEMKNVIKERVMTQDFRDYLLKKVTIIERKFLGGKIDTEQAQRELDQIR